nr:MAG TPA: hypothetical protein [Caudoviricetes sp.]
MTPFSYVSRKVSQTCVPVSAQISYTKDIIMSMKSKKSLPENI